MGFTWFYWVLPSFTGLYHVLLGFTGFYWVLLGFTGFCQCHRKGGPPPPRHRRPIKREREAGRSIMQMATAHANEAANQSSISHRLGTARRAIAMTMAT